MTPVIIISSLIGLGLVIRFFASASVRCYKRTCCRVIGIILPSKNLFKRIFNRVFIIAVLELFISAFISLAPMDSFKEEFQSNRPDGWSAILALVVICVTGVILLHMSYIIITYFSHLDDHDIKSSYGHYYVDLKTTHVSQALYHVIFICRRLIFIMILFFMKDHPE